MATDLAEKMRLRADAGQLPADHPLRTKADAFEEACKGYYATPQIVDVRKFMSCWARARSAWSEYSGEPLI